MGRVPFSVDFGKLLSAEQKIWNVLHVKLKILFFPMKLCVEQKFETFTREIENVLIFSMKLSVEQKFENFYARN